MRKQIYQELSHERKRGSFALSTVKKLEKSLSWRMTLLFIIQLGGLGTLIIMFDLVPDWSFIYSMVMCFVLINISHLKCLRGEGYNKNNSLEDE